MGSLDQPSGSVVKREIDIVDVTPYSMAQVITYFNTNLGPVGWHIIQFVQAGSNKYLLVERDIQ